LYSMHTSNLSASTMTESNVISKHGKVDQNTLGLQLGLTCTLSDLNG